MGGGFPIELILFAMVAAFLVLRLRSVLGRRTGFERPPAPEARAAGYDPRGGRVVDGVAEEVAPPQAGRAAKVVPDPRTPPGQALGRIAAADRGFDPERFLDGAEGAFRMIIQAFATGDRQTLRALLSDDTYAGFEQAITAREQAGEQQRTELRAVNELAIEAADLRGTVADVTVRFVTDQINMTIGRGGEVVAGSDAITELTDLWTFQRDLNLSDPTWKLVATRSL
ncbi:calcium-binding protein [Siccirubricoccus deserti]|uniref:Tim44 domain-containing protein n=1 Tax=Siccirubricoccus deserti TaxID=2013562 RepID=A0A9X0QVU2_9PROT|nr:Tim44/TimA family putative adaptor protein [Siccirubricoccus deserti]MBC4013848.1 Tim44 domain-containing protein [Siccirubricoccus deserti]GGC29981.1 calcium-binding protein [Siccirubricoccus deserti]